MRAIVPVLTAIFLLSTLACGEVQKAKRRERGGLSEAEYKMLSSINAALVDTQDAMSLVIGPKAAVSGKATAMSKVMEAGKCVAVRHDKLASTFDSGRPAVQQFEGPDTCPVYNYREWKYQVRGDLREMIIRHVYTVKPNHPEYLKDTFVKNLSAGNGRFFAKPDIYGTQRVQGELNYESFQFSDGTGLTVKIQTAQTYRGNSGNGTITLTITKPGDWSFTGGVRWNARNFDERKYFVANGDIDVKNFRELFSFFRLDEIVDISERLR